jgi:[acyl-carrier-protein] S-malonyltransferase
MTLAILCPGQGLQHAAMLDLAARDADARAVLDEATAELDVDLRALLREPGRLFDNRIAQPMICAAQLGAWHALRKALPVPRLFAGYSVGELASHACAGAFDARALCRVADVRARAMDDAGVQQPGTMVAIEGLPRDAIERLCDGRQAWLAIVIDDTRCVVGGARRDADAVAGAAVSRGAQVHRLAVAVASHTPLMAPAVAPLRAALEAVRFTAVTVPVLAGVDASTVLDRASAIRALCAQMTMTLQWERCLRAAYERGCRVFLELGPGSALSRMVREHFADAEARSIDDFRSLEGAIRWTLARIE